MNSGSNIGRIAKLAKESKYDKTKSFLPYISR